MFEIEFSQQATKVKQLANAIQDAISIGEFSEGSSLPSINDLSKRCNVARDTVFKSFQMLKASGVIESTPTKGYYVATSITQVFVMFDIFSPYKNDLYHAITGNLPANYKIDLYFHHYNKKIFDTIIRDNIGKYNLYLIMNIANDVYSTVLDELDSNRVLLLDFGSFEKNKYPYVCQGFDNTLYECLMTGVKLFKKYKKITLFFPESSEHPRSCIPYFEKFCADNFLENAVITRELFSESDVHAHEAYLIVRHSDLIDLAKICREKGLTMGKDIGVVTFNDAPMLEVIGNGITAISTDFKEMGRLASEFIQTKQKIQTYVPTKLIIRGSL
jgi:DNA-binding transcriptional regulator YhcF (GntR family)